MKALRLWFLAFLTLMTLVTGCASGRQAQKAPVASLWATGDTVDPHRPPGPGTSDELNQELADGSFGPFPESDLSPSPTGPTSGSNKVPVVGLILGPGLNRAVAHVAILKKLEESKIKIHILSGSGMGLVVAAMYAGGISPSKIEWELFNFFQNYGHLAPFSAPWCQKVEDLLIGKIGRRKIESFPKSLVIPLYDVEQKQLRFFVKGEIRPLIRAALQLYHGKNRPERWINAMGRIVFGRQMLANYRTDLVVGVDVLGGQIVFADDSGFLLGNFKKIAGLISKQKNNVDLFWQLPSSNYPLDDNSNIAQFLVQGNDYIREKIPQIKAKLAESPDPGTPKETDDPWPER